LLLVLADGAAAGPFGGGAIMQLAPLLIMFLIFYFLLIRPQQKKQRDHQDWLKNLSKEDEVVTSGGLVGKIKGLTDQVVTLELQEKVRVRVLRSHIAGKAPTPGQALPRADVSK
jgi:preprotein translocase subunit YajC